VSPGALTLVPRHAYELRNHAMNVMHRFGPEVANSRLDIDPAIRLDQEKSIEPYRAANVTTARYANPACFHSASLRKIFPFVPLEHLGAAFQSFLEKSARGILLFPVDQWPEFRLALGRVDMPDGDL